MQLAAKRNVMREEDIAYSLMGVCGVSISIAYGEGAERAFFRLMTEVLNTSRKVVDIFNCAQKEHPEHPSIIPSGPLAYLQCSKDVMWMRHYPPIEPLLLTHVGLRMPTLLMPSLREDDPGFRNAPIGDYYATLRLPGPFSRNLTSCHLLDKGIKKSIAARQSFAILNFKGDTNIIYVQYLCLAVCLELNFTDQVEWDSTSSMSVIKRVATEEPIVFRLKNRRIFLQPGGEDRYVIKRSELAKHGITLTTMYL
ncbi:hypothetical protein BJ912DRAFT_86635 [Pholiota molesta]|nr:hypothetical protein BJ912DRAFT_86635 [Pholiota molesta]